MRLNRCIFIKNSASVVEEYIESGGAAAVTACSFDGNSAERRWSDLPGNGAKLSMQQQHSSQEYEHEKAAGYM